MRESKDLSNITTFELFLDLKAFESNPTVEFEDDQDELALFIKQFKKYVKGGKSTWKRSQSKPTGEGEDSKGSKGSNSNRYLCYNCGKPGHFIKDCPYPETKKYSDDERATRIERKRKQDKEMIRALLSELEKSKDDSPSSSKPSIEFEDEDSRLCSFWDLRGWT
ncbi:hypothetical protein ACS0TY_011798 [Phlomoides rotata]